jgi:hypothetical protein
MLMGGSNRLKLSQVSKAGSVASRRVAPASDPLLLRTSLAFSSSLSHSDVALGSARSVWVTHNQGNESYAIVFQGFYMAHSYDQLLAEQENVVLQHRFMILVYRGGAP